MEAFKFDEMKTGVFGVFKQYNEVLYKSGPGMPWVDQYGTDVFGPRKVPQISKSFNNLADPKVAYGAVRRLGRRYLT